MSKNKKLNLPAGTSLAFRNDDSLVCKLTYSNLITKCPEDCNWDHDCYKEDFVAVTHSVMTAIPLSRLETIFDKKDGSGRPFVAADIVSNNHDAPKIKYFTRLIDRNTDVMFFETKAIFDKNKAAFVCETINICIDIDDDNYKTLFISIENGNEVVISGENK